MTTLFKPGQSVTVIVKPISERGKPSKETGVFERYERNVVKDKLGREVTTFVVKQERADRIKPIEVKFYSHNILDIQPND